MANSDDPSPLLTPNQSWAPIEPNSPGHVGPHPIDVQDLLFALRSIDPTARIATPIHDEITVICTVEHAVACSEAMHAWVERTFTLRAAGFAHGLPDGQALISTKWSGKW